ncbi:MAG TPA: lectin-like protein, partial [Polyangiaceae bacterium]|nr:lectin-like protein [Polyangiaceae bacterium]
LSELWLGANDISTEKRWVWADAKGTQFWQGGPLTVDGAPVGGRYTNWLSGEPNDAYGVPPGEDCAILRTDERWEDQACDLEKAFVCEAL